MEPPIPDIQDTKLFQLERTKFEQGDQWKVLIEAEVQRDKWAGGVGEKLQ